MDIEAHKFVEKTIDDALKADASDIFFIPSKDMYSVRRRVEGVQEEIAELPYDYGNMCVAHLKALAGLLTYRTRISQDGVIRDTVDSGNSMKFADSELRISTFPTICGERIAIRIIKEGGSASYIEDLGFSPEAESALKRMVVKPCGLQILTGPTGSGKTTTIYAMIRELLRNSQDSSSIITIEDPVESVIEGVSQSSVSKSGDEWGYAKALRAALRQDVKTLVIGEMRDREVVKVALDAALTGHRVITTYHAGDIPSVFARMLHQGFEPFLIAAAVSGVVTQRLVKAESGEKRIPVVALLETDDDWKDFISAGPQLCEIRRKIASIPGADLMSEAERMEKRGIISPNWRLEI